MITPPIKYFMYTRKSTESEDRQVASIPSQIDELKNLAKQQKLKIIEILSEEKSAKAPGRPVFSKMIEDIHNGVADGIICWKLDRLARNPIDGGTINWMLQQNIIQHIQTFQRSYLPQDNSLMMHLEFGMANQFILDLSVNTKRGQRNKIQNGWLPHKPPIGYVNNQYNQPNKPPIYKDPDKFPIMKKLWDILLKEKCSIESLYEKAEEWGLKTDKGNIINRSCFYSLFRNPFYYGDFRWNNEIYSGKHEPMISKENFLLAQTIIDGRCLSRPQYRTFAFTGLIRCGECGASITAEKKEKHQKNGNVHHYTYYRCTKRIKRDCSQKPIREEDLEQQIASVLEQIEIPPSFHKWAVKYLKEEQAKEQVDQDEINKTHQKALDKCMTKINNLLNMRVDEEVSNEEYVTKKEELLQEKQKYEELIVDSSHRAETWLERAETLFSFAETARKRFKIGTLEEKKSILSCLGSNLSLTNRLFKVSDEKNIVILKKLAPEVQTLHNRLEPLYPIENIEVYEKSYAQNKKWGG